MNTKRRKKVWVVVGRTGVPWFVYSAKKDAREYQWIAGTEFSVLPAILEYDLPIKGTAKKGKKDQERQVDDVMAYREKAKALLRGTK